MPRRDALDIDRRSSPFDRFRNIQRLGPDRSGRASIEHVRHQLYVGHDTRTRTNVLIKLTSKPGVVYEHNLTNEIASLSTINRDLPNSPYFPFAVDHGRLRDGRLYVITSLFDEWPLATAIEAERLPNRLVAHLRTAIEIARALAALHSLPIVHVDLNPMNVLYRAEHGRPVIRIVDFESSYDVARHATGLFYDPPTTPGYSAPEIPARAPDGRSDVYSLGAILYTMLAGYEWTWSGNASASIEANPDIDPELAEILVTAAHAEPDRRYRSIQGLHDALAAYLERIWPGRSW